MAKQRSVSARLTSGGSYRPIRTYPLTRLPSFIKTRLNGPFIHVLAGLRILWTRTTRRRRLHALFDLPSPRVHHQLFDLPNPQVHHQPIPLLLSNQKEPCRQSLRHHPQLLLHPRKHHRRLLFQRRKRLLLPFRALFVLRLRLQHRGTESLSLRPCRLNLPDRGHRLRRHQRLRVKRVRLVPLILVVVRLSSVLSPTGK